MTTAARDFREMDREHLSRRAQELEGELMHLRENVRSGKEKNHAKIAALKSDVARAKTILREKELTKL
jgi:large subunit ribosomal protein L29